MTLFYLLKHLFHLFWPVRRQGELLAIGFADVMENIRWYILFLSPHCFIVPLVYITVSLLPMSSPTLFYPPQKIYQYQCSSQLWIARSVEVSMVPLSHSLGQEPHQASVVLSYCCVGFCLPSLPVCGLPAQLIHHHPTVHLPHCLKAESFNQARVPCCSERVIITLASLIILEAVLICVFSQRIVVPTKKVQRS